MERRLSAIVAVDVVGYSRLMGQDETGTLAAVGALRRDIIEPAITRRKQGYGDTPPDYKSALEC